MVANTFVYSESSKLLHKQLLQHFDSVVPEEFPGEKLLGCSLHRGGQISLDVGHARTNLAGSMRRVRIVQLRVPVSFADQFSNSSWCIIAEEPRLQASPDQETEGYLC